uniref:HTH CENPB-type domain-containing protein n=1 Tax=Globisporangium ultimum (strain ATCC 200006 / CBS 805.95 / DAOM BR144) TaxID=431595 RepID=K3X045_GLOUD
MAGKGRGKRLTDSERMEIIARLEDKTTPLSRAKCARIYGVTPAAISKLMKVSQTVKKRYSDAGADAGHLRDKRQRGGFSKNMCFEDELYKWICSIRARKIPLLVAHVQQKAKLLASKHHMNDDFKASNGWYYRFCARYGLAPGSLHAGGGSTGGVSNDNCAVVASNVINSGITNGTERLTGDDCNGVAATLRMNVAGGRNDGNDDERATNNDMKNHVAWSDDPETSEQMSALQATVKQYGPEFVYSLSEARLFYRLLPAQLDPVRGDESSCAHKGTNDDGTDENKDSSKGNTERVLVLVCANGTGTHKIPLLVVGKHARPSCFVAATVTPHGHHQFENHASLLMQTGDTKYFSQREVWCDNQTFQYWCTNVFLPAIQQHTTQRVLLLMDNPGGNLEKCEHPAMNTYFLPTRAGNVSGNTLLQVGGPNSQSKHTHAAQFQPMQHGVIRELKRRYKIAVFQEMLSFYEKSDEERYRLLQRALKRPQGAAGIAFGRLPHVLDAMRLLSDVWRAIPIELLRSGWVRSSLYAEGFPDVNLDSHHPDISDDTIVHELCAMLRKVRAVDELHGLPKEIRLWMYADDDSSERMQQELLHDVQRLLQEEEEEIKLSGGGNGEPDAKAVPHPPLMGSSNVGGCAFEVPVLHPMPTTHLQHPDMPPPMYIDHTNMMHYGYHQQQHAHQHPFPPQQQQQQHGSPALLREKRKTINFVFRALSNAEEALDSADVAEYFGDDATNEAAGALQAVLRRLRRVQRGKQSSLPAPAAATADADAARSGDNGANDSGATAAHSYFYGGALR